MEGEVSSSEVVELLRKVGDGEIVPVLDHKESDLSGCTSLYIVDGWELLIYWDCDSLDYIEGAISPDGRIGVFDDWVCDPGIRQEPTDVLHSRDEKCYDRMEKVFDSVRLGKHKARITLLRATKEDLINGIKLIIGRENGKPWPEVTDEDVMSFVEFVQESPEVKDGTE